MRIMGFGLRRPKTANPGRSMAGIVEAVGQNVSEFKQGDEVYGTCDGSFAEFALAQPEQSTRHRSTSAGGQPNSGPDTTRQAIEARGISVIPPGLR